jgi:hypothetical protein
MPIFKELFKNEEQSNQERCRRGKLSLWGLILSQYPKRDNSPLGAKNQDSHTHLIEMGYQE